MKNLLGTVFFLFALTISVAATADGALDNLKGDWQSHRQTGKKLPDGSPESLWHMQVATVVGDQMILNVPHEGNLERQYRAGEIIVKDIRFLGTCEIPARPTHGVSAQTLYRYSAQCNLRRRPQYVPGATQGSQLEAYWGPCEVNYHENLDRKEKYLHIPANNPMNVMRVEKIPAGAIGLNGKWDPSKK